MNERPTSDELEQALRTLVEELGERAAEGGVDPLYQVAFRLRSGSDAKTCARAEWSVVASHSSGHGPESAYVVEDEVCVRLLGTGEGELVIRGTEREEETRRVEWSGEGVEPLVAPVREIMEDRLPTQELPEES